MIETMHTERLDWLEFAALHEVYHNLRDHF